VNIRKLSQRFPYDIPYLLSVDVVGSYQAANTKSSHLKVQLRLTEKEICSMSHISKIFIFCMYSTLGPSAR